MKSEDFFQAIYQIIRTGHWITDQVSQELKEYDISEPQFNVLRILRGRKGDPISVQEIQDNMIQKSSNVTRIIDKLQLKGLVQRRECSSNRRKMDIIINHDGLRFLKKLDAKVSELHRPLMKNLSSSETRQLTSLIKKLTNQ